MKIALIISSIMIMVGALPILNLRSYIYLTIIFVFFPVYISVMGRDAITTGTVCIFFLFLKYLMESFFKKNFIKETYDYWVYLLIILGAVSVILPYSTDLLGEDMMGMTVRQFFNFLGAMLLFIIVKNSQTDSGSQSDHIENLLSFLLIMVSVHIMIAVTVKFIPSFGSAFYLFLPRTRDILDIYGRGEIERIMTFVFNYESFGEILATLSPIVIYKAFMFRTNAWFFCFLLFCYGILLTATRSGILLFLLGVIICFLFYSTKMAGKSFTMAYTLISLFILLLLFYPSIFSDTFYRFSITAGNYHSGESFFKVINREGVFLKAWDLTMSNLSFFGNGVTEFNYHNLFLTTLHRKGILGVTIFFCVLFYPLIRLTESYHRYNGFNKTIIFSCLLSMTLFLINEFKYEFTRAASYQQICWGLFATYYLIGNKRYEEQNTDEKIENGLNAKLTTV